VLGRKDYTQEELDAARDAVSAQLAAYKDLASTVDGAGSDPKAAAALEALETVYFNNMVLVLDRLFVHRIRSVAGKDCNPLNEVELLVESLMGNAGVFRGNQVIKYVPEQTVLQLDAGDRIALTQARYEALAAAFLAEIEARFR
jgi:hypothetical protein